MCAISGIIGGSCDPETARVLLETMRRRGPDASGQYQKDEATLLHTRLAVIDPDGGAQPMLLEWGAEQYVLVYNGELYNAGQLRRELSAQGHTFQGHSDTEVVLHAYAAYKEACLERFNGIFAFAVWEVRRKRLFLARDRIGVKPLFYCHRNRQLLFASEIKTILACPGVRAALDAQGAAQLILLGPGRIPGSGVFRDIYELEPGCCAEFYRGKLEIRRYWKLTDRDHRENFSQTADHVRYLVTDAIRRQMVADVPVGTFLSGGLDSSLITAVCAQEYQKQGKRLDTFSVDYENNDKFFSANKFQPTGDSAYIRLMQESVGTEHHWTVLTPQKLLSTLEDATIARDLPGMADVDFSLLAFCADIRDHVKVALSGECADEIFGGYPWYRDPEIREMAGFPWAQNTAQRASLLAEGISVEAETFVMDAYRQTCHDSDILPGCSQQERRMKEMVNLNFRWFMQTLLDRKDRMSMYNGLEVRIPFCDYRIAEYLYGVPWEYKDWQGREKGLLRHAMEGMLPDQILYRKKSPYPKTHDPQYLHLVSRRLRKLLEEDSALWHLVRRDAVQAYLQTDAPWPWYGQLMRRPQTIAYLLQVEFWLRHYDVDIRF